MDTVSGSTAKKFYFIGVTTGQSSIMKVFPRWMEALGRQDVELHGVDHVIHDSPENYRNTVSMIREDAGSLGGLVTTHKIDLLEAARDLFDELDDLAQITGEISSISKRGKALWGHARDPISSGLSLDSILGEGYFGKTGGHVLCFGAGGSGKSISLHFMQKLREMDQPGTMILVDCLPERLEAVQSLAERMNARIEFRLINNEDPLVNDSLLGELPPGSVVINATGLGKDKPGSPITDRALFPEHGVAWEINYRGALEFWHQAARQQETRAVQVEDGWVYFLHGWTQVIAEVLHIPLTPEIFSDLAQAVEEFRPGRSMSSGE